MNRHRYHVRKPALEAGSLLAGIHKNRSVTARGCCSPGVGGRAETAVLMGREWLRFGQFGRSRSSRGASA